MTRADPLPLRVRFGEFELDEANALLLRGGRAIDLPPTPFGLLCALARHPGSLLTKQTLLDAVWGHQFVSDSVLKTAISDLRSVLMDDPRKPRYIETVARRGYRFIAKPAALPSATPLRSDAPEIDEPGATAFVGRAAELARLQRAWDRASHDKRAVVWVAGAPGVGKTTLIERFLSGHRDGACARGYCVEHFGGGEPYLPVLEALAQLCRIDDSLPPLLRSVAPTWLLQLPWLGTVEDRESLRRELAGVGPDRMLREMGELLDRYTEQRPLLLITEDLHWSDRATIQLIDYVARRRSGARLMWLASFRLADVVAFEHPLNTLRHELRLHGLCEEIVLDPFSESEVAAYLSGRSSSLGSNERFVRALHVRTDGVPLFLASVIEEVLARAEPSGTEAIDADELARVAVPENVAAIIDRYVLKLSPERRALLSAAAVCGVEFRLETVARALGREVVEIADACDQLMREQQWLAVQGARDESDAQEASHGFRHAVFREVLYERLPPSIRAELHRKVGMALEQERAAGRVVKASELAMHFDRGRAPMAALRHYAEAAEAALLHLSPNECMSLTERALSLLDQAPPACGTHDTRDLARDAARPGCIPRAGRRQRGCEHLAARGVALGRNSVASDAGAPAARLGICADPARGVRRGARDRGSRRGARRRIRGPVATTRRQHLARTRLHDAGAPARVLRVVWARTGCSGVGPNRCRRGIHCGPASHGACGAQRAADASRSDRAGAPTRGARVRPRPPARATDGAVGHDLVRRTMQNPSWRYRRSRRASRTRCAHWSKSSH